MKKTNNKFRNNNNNYNNQIYSLNYKFDSISCAGKYSGTALDLIKRYNELAKEAHGNGNYVEAEVFRQYAEHYRKIVTEINEKKNQRMQFFKENDNTPAVEASVEAPQVEAAAPVAAEEIAAVENTAPAAAKREFKIIEISHAESKAELIAPAEAEKSKPVRTRRKTVAADSAALQA